MKASSADETPAIACRLNAADYQARTQRFAGLNRESLVESQASGLCLHLTYSLDADAILRELVQLEQECCPFLTFRLEAGEGSVQLFIEVPESAGDLVNVLLEPFRLR